MRLALELDILHAKIIGHRTMVLQQCREPFVEYQIQINTSKGIVMCWKRYSEFRTLRDGLKKTHKLKANQLPALPRRRWFSNLSTDTIVERKQQLNVFLAQLVKTTELQWGIQIDDSLAVIKRRRHETRNTLDSIDTSLVSPQWRCI